MRPSFPSCGNYIKPYGGVNLNPDTIVAVAVLVTLVYLAIQTRDNTRVMRSKAVWDAQVSFVEVNELLGDGGNRQQTHL